MNAPRAVESVLEKVLGMPSRLVVPYCIPVLIKEFNFFNGFGSGRLSLEEINRRFGFDERVGTMMVYYLLKENFLAKDKGKFSINPEALNILTGAGSFDLSNYALLSLGVIPEKFYLSVKEALSTGKPAKWREETWEDSMRSGLISKGFSSGVASRAELLRKALFPKIKPLLKGRRKILDIGGSLGDYSGYFTENMPGISSDVFELPEVAKAAEENVRLKGYRNVKVIPGDMFEGNLPQGYDTHFYSNVFHDWGPADITRLLRKSHKGLPKDGVILIHDMHLNEDRVSPAYVVDHSLYLSIFTEGRCYSKGEIIKLLKRTGYPRTEVIDSVPGFSVICGFKS